MQRKCLMRAGAITLATLLLLALSNSTSLFAQLNTGKVEGTVRDKDTGAPLAGTQVTVEGTRLGNVTNADGYFFILNVPPGLKSITFSYTGYQTTTVADVLILAGQTMTVDGDLSSTVVQLEGITVEAEVEPLVPRDETTTKRRMTTETIEQTPVARLEDLMILQAGVQIGGEGARERALQIRGGRIGEEAMIVDGVMVRNYTADVYRGGGGWRYEFEEGTLSQDATPLEFSTSSVEQVDIITGGFQAEYGNAQSGIVNIVTKEGGQKLKGNVRFTTDGLNPRTSDYGYNQLRADIGGPVPVLPNLYFHASGEARGQEDRSYTHADEGFRGINQDFVDHLNNSIRNDPYYEGKTPFTLEGFKTAREFFAGKVSTADYPVNPALFSAPNPVRLPQNWADFSAATAKLTYSPMSKLKVIATNHWSRNQHSYPAGGTNEANGNYFRDGIIDIKDPINGAEYDRLFGNAPWRADGSTSVYIPQAYARRTRTNNLLAGFDWDFWRSANNSGALQFRYTALKTIEVYNGMPKVNWRRDSFLGWTSHDIQFEVETYPGRENLGRDDPLETKANYEKYFPDGEIYWKQNVPLQMPFQNETTTWYAVSYNYLREIQDNYKADLDFQLGRYNRAKAGFQFTDLSNWRFYTNGQGDRLDPRLAFKYNPQVFAWYIQNRTDLQDFVIDYGIRYDQSKPRENWGMTNIDIWGEHVFPKTVREWSPRFDVAFPVTDKAQLRFSYGVFAQLPSMSMMFGGSSGGSAIMNTGNLEYSRTDAFEAGLTYLLSNDIVMDFVTYYKDITGNVSRRDYYRDYWAFKQERRIIKMSDGLTNRDSGNIKGMDLILNKRFSNNFALNLQYTLQFSRTTGSQAGAGFYSRLDPATGEAFREPDELNPIDNDRTHQFSGQVNYLFPEDFQSGTLAGDILKNFRTFAVLRLQSGAPGSGSSIGGLVYGDNYFRGRWFTDLTLRFTKTFRLAKATRLDVFAEIFNATNRKNLVPYPSNEKYEYYDNRPGTDGKTLKWSDDLHPDKKVLFNADMNGDGILTVDEQALGGIAHSVMNDIMDKRDWGYARRINAGVGLSF